ncbi:hypothetical protein RB195_007508 [Necator americanus]|uniref:Uncharacterized protein n=1 Tax=Necator americanus TaxID=51031 RepID=A0ABR1BXP2_NECAM
MEVGMVPPISACITANSRLQNAVLYDATYCSAPPLAPPPPCDSSKINSDCPIGSKGRYACTRIRILHLKSVPLQIRDKQEEEA